MSNFTQRLLTTIIGGAIMVAIIIFGRELLLATLLILSVIGYYELTCALGVCERGHLLNPMTAAGYLGIILWYVSLGLKVRGLFDYNAGMGVGVIVIILCLLAHMTVYVVTFPRFDASATFGSIMSVIYLPVMLSYLYMIRSMERGILYVWMVPICSWICDICAYLVGMKLGRHKMTPKLSPKKSVEGAIGGVLGSAIVGGVYAAVVVVPGADISSARVIALFIIMSVCGALISMVGDLAASAIKRNCDIKDYGHLLPGHGGVMDRFDSFIFVTPLVYVLCNIL